MTKEEEQVVATFLRSKGLEEHKWPELMKSDQIRQAALTQKNKEGVG